MTDTAIQNDQVLDPKATWDSRELAHESQLNHCAFSPCGKFVFAGAYDGTLQRWDLETETKTPFAGHHGWLDDFAFHPDGERMYTVDTWGKLAAWNYADENPQPKWTVDPAHESWIRALKISPDGQLLATGGNDLTVRLWSADDGTPVRQFEGHTRHVFSLAFHPDGRSLVSGDYAGRVKHWDVESGKLVREIDAGVLFNKEADRIHGGGGVREMAFSPDGSKLVCSGITSVQGSTVAGHPGALLFDWESGEQQVEMRPVNYEEVYKVKGVFIEGLRFHPAGFLVAVGGNGEREGAMWFWKPGEAEPFHELNEIPGSRSVDLHPDGIRLAVSQFKENGRGKNGGNGRKAEMDEYRCHHGVVRFYTMAAKPAEVETEEKKP